MKHLLLFCLLLVCALGDFLDYTSDHMLVCKDIDESMTYQQSLQYLWTLSILHDIDRYVFLITIPVLILVQIIFIMVFIKYKQTLFRRQGTIFFAIIVIQTTINLYYFIHAVYASIYDFNQPMPPSFPIFCAVFGVINEAADCALTAYLFYFIVYTFLNMKTSIKQQQVINPKILHLSVVILATGWILFLVFDQRLTINQFGLCGSSSLRYNTLQWFFPIFTIGYNIAYIMFAFYTYYYFKKHMPVNDSLVNRLYHENQSISYFVAIYSVLIMFFNFSVGIVYFNCFREPPLTGLLTFATIMNLSRVLQSIFLMYFIMSDPTIKKKIKRFLRRLFQGQNKSASFSLKTKKVDFSQPGYEQLDITLKEKILQLKELQHEIDLFKIAQIATMISGICVCHLEYFNTNTFTSSIRKLHFKEKITFQIQPKTLSDYKIQASKLPKSDILRGTITMIAPRIFSKLLHSDGLTSVQKSFDLSKNYHKMYNIAEGKGGKSGQFFFFSYDYKYVLKTVTKDEYNFIVQNLQQFFEYYQKNPKTLLAKIYGLYTIKGEDIGKEYDLILMKNVFGCQKKQVLRTYDIKGSKHDRQVIKEKEIYNELESLTLKDTDFLKLEGKIHIPRDKIKNLRNIVRKDTLFLKNFNLIDYSLLLIKVKWSQQPQNPNFWSQYQRIQSSLIPDHYYHIGIIDYMQAWNISKKGQNWLKSMMGKKQISAQEPNFYQKRFMQFFQQITYFPAQKLADQSQSSVADHQSDVISRPQTQQKKAPSHSKILQMQLIASSSPISPIPTKLQKHQSNLSKLTLQHALIIPHQLSHIQRKSSQAHTELSNIEMQAIMVRKDGIVSFKEMDRKVNERQFYSPQKERHGMEDGGQGDSLQLDKMHKDSLQEDSLRENRLEKERIQEEDQEE